jgi:hypothetical protein
MGVARTADVFTLADHTDQVKLSRLSCLGWFISRQGSLMLLLLLLSLLLVVIQQDGQDYRFMFAGIQKVQQGKSLNTKYQHYASVGSNRKWLNENRTCMTQIYLG